MVSALPERNAVGPVTYACRLLCLTVSKESDRETNPGVGRGRGKKDSAPASRWRNG